MKTKMTKDWNKKLYDLNLNFSEEEFKNFTQILRNTPCFGHLDAPIGLMAAKLLALVGAEKNNIDKEFYGNSY